jgi:dihydroorotate dehydrogenase electron transfer subunit
MNARRRLMIARLARRESIGDAYHVLYFDVPDGLEGRAGQFLMVRGAEWGDAPLLPRPMSLLTSGAAPSILIKVFGEGTLRMARTEPGEPFALLGPLGLPWRAPDAERRPILVAGGVGVAPLLFLARELAERGVRALSLYGGRSARDLPLADELARVSELEVATEDGSRGERGRVTELLERHLSSASAASRGPGGTEGPTRTQGRTQTERPLAAKAAPSDAVEVFTCGPDRMMARVAQLCAERGVPCEASLETPMACGYGVCLGCPVPLNAGGYLYACTAGPCVDARRIDWRSGEHAPNRASPAGDP